MTIMFFMMNAVGQSEETASNSHLTHMGNYQFCVSRSMPIAETSGPKAAYNSLTGILIIYTKTNTDLIHTEPRFLVA